MANDLFGSSNAAWDRFKTPVVPTRKKPSRFHPPPVLTVPDEMAEKIRARRASEAYSSGLETLAEWRGKLPQAEWDRLKAKVEGLK